MVFGNQTMVTWLSVEQYNCCYTMLLNLFQHVCLKKPGNVWEKYSDVCQKPSYWEGAIWNLQTKYHLLFLTKTVIIWLFSKVGHVQDLLWSRWCWWWCPYHFLSLYNHCSVHACRKSEIRFFLGHVDLPEPKYSLNFVYIPLKCQKKERTVMTNFWVILSFCFAINLCDPLIGRMCCLWGLPPPLAHMLGELWHVACLKLALEKGCHCKRLCLRVDNFTASAVSNLLTPPPRGCWEVGHRHASNASGIQCWLLMLYWLPSTGTEKSDGCWLADRRGAWW